jgi:hypothetical protein
VLTLSAKVLDVIFLPGTWNGFETASTYAEWNLLKNCISKVSRMKITPNNTIFHRSYPELCDKIQNSNSSHHNPINKNGIHT